MLEVSVSKSSLDVSPIVLALVGVTLLVVTLSASAYAWICCLGKTRRASKSSPIKLAHILKGINVYSEEVGEVKCYENKHEVEPFKDNQNRSLKPPVMVQNVTLAQSGNLTLASPDGNQNTIRSTPGLELGSPQNPSCRSFSEQSSPASRTDCDGRGAEDLSSSKSPSPFSLDSEDVHLGTLLFAVEYNFQKQAFVVTIREARSLPVMDDQTGSSDPYVKMTILPDKKHKIKTRVLRRTLDPMFDETFTFYGIAYNQLQSLVLHFLVLSFDRFSRDDVIGEVMVPLAGIDLSPDKVFLSRDITKRNVQKSVGRGEILVSLCYHPAASRLTVVVLKARHLPKTDIVGLSDPYVKVNIYSGKRRFAKKKTHVKKCTLNPVFNESFVFELPEEGLSDLAVELTVVDFDRTTKDEVIGRLALGPGTEHWREVCENPRRQIAKWHPLSEC
ncbi:synaptotagmin-11-like isoform X2 [Lampetra fluviatilis]